MSLRPVADRPDMPEYGVLPAEQGRGLLPWSWAAERMVEAVAIGSPARAPKDDRI